MKKNEKLNELFRHWQKNDDFVKDWIVCEEKYGFPKILFVLRDAHVSKDCTPPYDLRKDLVEHPEGEGRTWNNVARWIKALMGEQNFSQAESITPSELSKQMSRVAVINLKKAAGGSYADIGSICEAAKTDCSYIQKEIAICEPDFIISCGTFEILLDNIVTDYCTDAELGLRLSKGHVVDANIAGFRTQVVEYRHPGQGCSAEKSFLDMIEIRKVLGV